MPSQPHRRAILRFRVRPYAQSQFQRARSESGGPREREIVEAEIERAQRFSIPMTLRYRPAGKKAWKKGTVENISRSGVLFRAQGKIAEQTAVDIALVLEGLLSEEPPEVLCWGVIVRMAPSEKSPALMAAKIVHYDFVRPGEREALAAAVPLATNDRNLN